MTAAELELWGVMPDGTPVRITSGTRGQMVAERATREPAGARVGWCGYRILPAGSTYPDARHGWVTVAPGVLRPAILPGADPITGEASAAPGVVWYSPPGAGAWRDAPAGVAGTFRLQYVAGDFRPFTVPDGYRITA